LAEAQVAQLQLAGHRRVHAAPQYGAQACGQLAGVAGLGQIIVGAKLKTQDAIQRLTPGGEHQHR
jgi:hypothetical protein